jgi:hypothetical protein
MSFSVIPKGNASFTLYIFIDIRDIPLHVSLTHNVQYMQINIPIATPLNFCYYHYIGKYCTKIYDLTLFQVFRI